MNTIMFADRFIPDIILLRKTETRRAVDEVSWPYIEPYLGLHAAALASVCPGDEVRYAKYHAGEEIRLVHVYGAKLGRLLVQDVWYEWASSISQESLVAECAGDTVDAYMETLRDLYDQEPGWDPIVLAVRFRLQIVSRSALDLLPQQWEV